MANNFLANWKSREAIVPEVQVALGELKRIVDLKPQLSEPANWLMKLLPELIPQSEGASLAIDADLACSKLIDGVPLLRITPFVIAAEDFCRRFHLAASALRRVSSSRSLNCSFDPAVLARVISDGQFASLDSEVAAAGLDAGVGATLIRFAAFAKLTALNSALERHHECIDWQRGYCPTCGAPPVFAEFRGLEQLRYLRCGWCAASWQVPRLFCPFCGNRDHQSLGFIRREQSRDSDRLRTAVCDCCRRCVHSVNTLGRLTPLQIWVVEISSLDLGLIAFERGYL